MVPTRARTHTRARPHAEPLQDQVFQPASHHTSLADTMEHLLTSLPGAAYPEPTKAKQAPLTQPLSTSASSDMGLGAELLK